MTFVVDAWMVAVGVVGEGISGAAAPHSGNYHTVPGNTYVLPTWLQKPEM